jgi:hypothetical protein
MFFRAGEDRTSLILGRLPTQPGPRGLREGFDKSICTDLQLGKQLRNFREFFEPNFVIAFETVQQPFFILVFGFGQEGVIRTGIIIGLRDKF